MAASPPPLHPWSPEGVPFAVDRIDIRVSADPHPFYLAERSAIAENWLAESAANPRLYDGEMLLQSDVSIADGTIRATAHRVPFSTLLLWRRRRPAAPGYHLFGLPLVVSADGAVIAIRMAPHTANPGKVYCAAGSLDGGDIRDDRCDIDANMAREVAEETGLDLGEAQAGAGYHAVQIDRVLTIFRSFRFPGSADELLARARRHMRGQAEPEIDDAVAIWDSDPHRHAYAPFMPPVLRWFFDRGAP